MSSMSLLRPAMSAPRRPTKATSVPSIASQAAILAPDPPPCIVTVAGVSLLFAKGSLAWATVSVMRSPMTTTRANAVHHLAHLTHDPGGLWGGCPDARPQEPCDIELNSFGALPWPVRLLNA